MARVIYVHIYFILVELAALSTSMIPTIAEGKENSQEPPKVYKIRWLILGIFVLYSASNSMQWIQYSIIANIITDFYGVTSIAVDWTSMIYMVLYIPSVFPASFLLDKLVGYRSYIGFNFKLFIHKF